VKTPEVLLWFVWGVVFLLSFVAVGMAWGAAGAAQRHADRAEAALRDNAKLLAKIDAAVEQASGLLTSWGKEEA
jgi:hypothetical protein